MSAGDVRAAVVVPAAGSGRRMGGVQKQYHELLGEPVLLHALRPFLEHPYIELAVVALPPQDADDPPGWLDRPRIRVVAGGRERGDSVRNAIEAVPEDVGIVLVHDAARPLVSRAVIDRTLAVARSGRGAVAAVPVTDTIKEVDGERRIIATPARSRLWRAQTPQTFPRAVIADAYRRAREEGAQATDDAALVERFGGTVLIVEGAPENLKVTTPEDLAIAERLLRERTAGQEEREG